jgi:tetratricopeptide (TPR) repeat protein
MRCAVVCVALALLATGLNAQWEDRGRSSFRGSLQPVDGSVVRGTVSTHGADATGFRVLLMDQSENVPASTDVAVNGGFTFSGVRRGYYMLRLVDAAGRSICERTLSVSDIVETVELTVPANHAPGWAGGETISLAELQHKPPKEALKEADKGAAAARAKRIDKAIAHFDRCLEIDPEFAAVRQGLANLYLFKHDDRDAVTHLEALLRQRTMSVWAWANLSAVRFRLRRIPEAEAAARRTLALDDKNQIGRYILGISLASEGRNTDEALNSLRATWDNFPGGHLAAAHVLASRGDTAGAREQVEAYLATNPHGDITSVQVWLAQHPGPLARAAMPLPVAR